MIEIERDKIGGGETIWLREKEIDRERRNEKERRRRRVRKKITEM